jgi:hypothetical protein
MQLLQNPLFCFVCSSMYYATHPSFLIFDEKYFLPVYCTILHISRGILVANTVSLHDKEKRAQI